MAKKKKRNRRQGIISKALNAVGIAIALARPIQIAFAAIPIQAKFEALLQGLTFGLSDGRFDLNAGLLMYTPGAAAFGYRQLVTFAKRHFPVS